MRWLWLFVAVMLFSGSCTSEKIQLSKDEVLFSMVNRIPDFESFMTVDELMNFQTDLTKQNGSSVRLIERGQTEAGDIIYELQVGKGSHHALLYGFPDADDAVGAMTLLFVAQDLIAYPMTQDHLDYTWHMIVCVDPEKARLNEGWFKGALTLPKFAREFFRCPRGQLVEWNFPFGDTLSEKDMPAGTQALMDIIDEYPIDFVYSLHNSPFEGVSFTLSDDIPEVYAMLNRILSLESLPLSEKAAPIGTHFVAPGFYKVTLPDERQLSGMIPVEDIEGVPEGGIAQHIKQEHPQAFFLAIETPYFWDPRIGDRGTANASRAEVIGEATEVYREHMDFIESSFGALRERMIEHQSPFACAVADILLHRRSAEVQEMEEPATMSDFVHAAIDYKVPALLALGQYLRLLEAEQRAAMGMLTPELQEALDETQKRFVTLAEDLEQQLDYSVISIKRAASMQLMAALYIMDYLQNRQEGV